MHLSRLRSDDGPSTAEWVKILERQGDLSFFKAKNAAPPADAAADFQRIEQGLDALRRDADRLRERMVPAAGQPISAETLAALRTWTDEGADKLTRAVQRNREAIDDIAMRLDDLSRLRPSRWPVPLAILLGALAIAAAVLLSAPGRAEQLIDLFNMTVFPLKPHAENVPTSSPEPPAPAKPEIAAVTTTPPPAPQVTETPTPAVTEPPAPAAASPAAPEPQIAETPAPAVAEPPAPAPQVADAPAPTPAATALPPAAYSRIVLRATGDTWVEVRNRQGGALIARLLRDGDTWAVPDQAGLFLSTGNAGGLELLVDGTPAPSLGGVGGVRRDVPLDAGLVRAGRYTPDPTARLKPSAANR